MSKTGNLAALSAIFNPNDPPVVYYAEDPPYLPRIFVFYWPVHAVGSLASTSRIRTTILTAAGFKTFGAFSIAPNSSYYSAVHKLPEDKQRDDVNRGIAFALCRYFSEVPAEVKNAINDENVEHGIGLKWGQSHAAQVTCRMSKVINTDEVLEALRPFLKEAPTNTTAPQIRPIASIRKTRPSYLPAEITQTPSRFGAFTTPSKRMTSGSKQTPASNFPIVKKTGSTPTKQSLEQLEMLRFKMAEVIDTEDNYLHRLQQLIDLVVDQGRTPKSLSSKSTGSKKSQRAVDAMLHFPALLETIRELNVNFLEEIETVLRDTEEMAITYLHTGGTTPAGQPQPKDPMGVYPFAKALLNHFPKFPVPYREYLDLHSQVSSNLRQFLREDSTSLQIAPSLLMEPAQRISRYGLYIDTMLPHIPSTMTIAIRTLEKARKIIAEICEMEPAASTILDSIHVEYETRKRTLSPTKLISGLTRGNSVVVKEAPALTGSNVTKERETPRLLPSLSRSFSRKNRSRPALTSVLSEKDPVQANNIQAAGKTEKSDENKRPWSNGYGYSSWSLRSRSRPATAGSTTTTSTSGQSRPGSRDAKATLDSSYTNTDSSPLGHKFDTLSIDERAKLQKLEDENYRLLAENAELKRIVRECKCGGVKRENSTFPSRNQR